MLKVVGASWLQTRIATYILVAVALLGIGAIVIGEFGGVENDGTYSATVSWNSKEGYRIHFWGQGNDLRTLSMGAARAYYKPRIHEIGWSVVEIETSSNYPDEVQAYSAGLLEGSLTWQIIHHHWYNTIATACKNAASICAKIREDLKAHLVIAKKRAADLESEDSLLHMIRLFYAQLDGLEAGWKFAVRRSRKSADISSTDFLWLAIASDLPNVLSPLNDNSSPGGIFLKRLHDDMSEPVIALIHNTIAPYAKMLRLLKKYTFGYHMTGLKNATQVPNRSIIMSSYPGALSSQDEYYILNGQKTSDIMVIAGTPLKRKDMETSHHSVDNSNYVSANDKVDENKAEFHLVIASAKIMAANWLSSDMRSWSRLLGRRDKRESVYRPLQWVIVHAASMSICLVEQHPVVTDTIVYTNIFNEKGILFFDGNSVEVNLESNQQISTLTLPSEGELLMRKRVSRADRMAQKLEEYTKNIQKSHMNLAIENDKAPIQNNSYVQNLSSKLLDETPELKKSMMSRGDLEKMPTAFGAIDSKLSLINIGGIFRFEATSGPLRYEDDIIPFEWTKAFPHTPHIGHPDIYNFETVTPDWVWV